MEPRWAGGLLLNTHLQPRTCDLHTERRDWTGKHDGVNSLVDNTSIWHFLNTSTKTSSSPSPRHSCRWDVMEEQMKHQCESPVFTAFKHSSLTLTLTLWHSLSLYLLYFGLLVPFASSFLMFLVLLKPSPGLQLSGQTALSQWQQSLLTRLSSPFFVCVTSSTATLLPSCSPPDKINRHQAFGVYFDSSASSPPAFH